MMVPTLLLALATLLCASAAPAREVLFAASPSESIDTRSGAGLVSPWSGFDPQANAVTAYFSKDMTPTPTVMVHTGACAEYLSKCPLDSRGYPMTEVECHFRGIPIGSSAACVGDGGVKSPKIDVDSEIDLSNGLGADNVRSRRRARRARRRRPNARPPPRPSAPSSSRRRRRAYPPSLP